MAAYIFFFCGANYTCINSLITLTPQAYGPAVTVPSGLYDDDNIQKYVLPNFYNSVRQRHRLRPRKPRSMCVKRALVGVRVRVQGWVGSGRVGQSNN